MTGPTKDYDKGWAIMIAAWLAGVATAIIITIAVYL